MSSLADRLHILTETIGGEKGLQIVAYTHGDLAVVRNVGAPRERLTHIIKLAGEQGLRVKWLNEGTLVAIGLPTQKPPAKHGKEEGIEQSTEKCA